MSVKLIEKTETGIETYRITNKNGLYAEVITFGARIHRLVVPDKNGVFADVVAGFDSPEGYRGENPYFNAIIGRTVNRIGNARFTLNGKEYKLFVNDAKNCLHGGKVGFDSRIFTPSVPDENGNELRLTYVSPDGEEGYPGTLSLTVTYTLSDENALGIRYDATCDEDTVFNPTNHAYFNLDGDFKSILDTELYINSHRLTESDDELICHGDIADVTGTAFDFSTPKTIGKDINAPHKYFENAHGGYDFNYVIDKKCDGKELCARAISHKSGRVMDVYTDRPCVQLYTGNFLDGTLPTRIRLPKQSTLCLETQGYPNACNVPTFPSITLKKGEKFSSVTEYVFSVEK